MARKKETLRVHVIEGVVVISTMTDFTLSMEKVMEDVYEDLCNKGHKKILFEFHPENYITSAGIAILISLISEGMKRDQEIGLTGLSDYFKKIFNLIGITRYTRIYNSLDEALQKMSEPLSADRARQVHA
ncbi:MAG: STAS domain-containing protein [bacterium]